MFFRFFILIFYFLTGTQNSYSQSNESLPWLKYVDPDGKATELISLKTEASVTVSDGMVYNTKSLYVDNQRAFFQLNYPNKITHLGLEGKYYWSFDGTTISEVTSEIGAFILGHQFHANILLFSRIHNEISDPVETIYDEKKAIVVTTEDGWSFYFEKSGKPLGSKVLIDGEEIHFSYSKFKKYANYELPSEVIIHDGERKFTYIYNSIEFDDTNLEIMRPPVNILSEEQKLMRIHRLFMDDHYFERTSDMEPLMGDSLAMLYGGLININTGEQTILGLKRIMASRYHYEYNDLKRPIIKIANSGDLAWVLAEIEAKGIRIDEKGNETGPLEFQCSWIMLHEKINGEWKLVGNVSTFKE